MDLVRTIQKYSPSLPVDVRILSATHEKLDDLVHHGIFRQGLYYWKNVTELSIRALERAI